MTETTALIVAHGQPSDPDPAEAALARFAARVAASAPGLSVHSATLAAPGRLEAVLEGLPETVPIYPLFMARGWFVTSALPRRLGGRANPILDPLGIDQGLPALIAAHLAKELDQRGWPLADSALVLAAHGSGRSRNPSAVANGFAEQLQSHLGLARLSVGFVEETPSITEAARRHGAMSLCLPFFACAGGHANEDVPQALEQAGYAGDLLPVLGELPPVPALIARRISEAGR
ncbi:CbiX/SirB N-terminal domain-containing protein [Ruegeria pomeroyi]|nr:CbiX/SirB N-terminal domain-containing protein [Ruegeria pomeroyi]NVK97636.1 CbiX/SirB N-terminal domain-containing protein [Ruegeria pomeroyi]NVL02765.1 CbiX/SirB N-terminal domain-containing protein [Ruegeria pomeroyi]QWV09548.1 CbiX/SirB N-terminal domain-containing protein [Ruegeria pomeroyi]